MVAGTRPNRDISIEFETRSKSLGPWIKICSTYHNEILHTSRQCYCHDVAKPAYYVMKNITKFYRISNSIETSLVGRAPGARPTKHISIEFEIRWKFETLLFQIYSTDQLHYRNVYKIVLWSAEYMSNQSTANFDLHTRIVEELEDVVVDGGGHYRLVPHAIIPYPIVGRHDALKLQHHAALTAWELIHHLRLSLI